jgi:hypothetical protein
VQKSNRWPFQTWAEVGFYSWASRRIDSHQPEETDMHTSDSADRTARSSHDEAQLAREYARYCARHDRTYELPHDAVIGVGIGHASLTCDGRPVFEESGQPPEELPTAADAERVARAEPHRDWRIHLVSLLEARHYRRQGDGRWLLYERGYGLS